jgi:pimeloyl-ACP methyl ester carboxylesterase
MLDVARPASPESLFVTAPDGLRLHVRAYGAASARLPILCLPGLTRTEADFETLAIRFASDAGRPRRVYALDYRGRGRSEHDPDWQNYDPRVELADVMAVTTALGLARAIFVGTSRGGILTMLLASVQPTLIAGAVLNDIGPVIEMKGLLRIKGYVGKTPRPRSYAGGVKVLRRLFGAQFPKLTDEQWLAWAKRSWEQREKALIARYDVKLGNTLKSVTSDTPPPPLWQPFDALSQVPVMVIRGLLSDLLSAETVEAMRTRRADLEVVEVPDQGHAPLLDDEPTLLGIEQFVRRCDEALEV